MTLYGKILVLTNFALSIFVMVFAMVFYYIDIYTDWTEGTKTQKGELALRKDRLDTLWNGVRTADAGWRDVRGDLNDQEQYRAADRSWYAAELKHAREDATEKNNPTRAPVFDKGTPALDAVANEPQHFRPRLVEASWIDSSVLVNNLPVKHKLASLKANTKSQADVHDALVAQQKTLADLVEQDRQLTNKLVPEEGKGLNQRLVDEREKQRRADEEVAIMTPLLINTERESRVILRRDKMLRERIKELETALGVASGK